MMDRFGHIFVELLQEESDDGFGDSFRHFLPHVEEKLLEGRCCRSDQVVVCHQFRGSRRSLSHVKYACRTVRPFAPSDANANPLLIKSG